MSDIYALIEKALDKGADGQTISRLVDLAEQKDREKKAQEFAQALTAFHERVERVVKKDSAARGKYAKLPKIEAIVLFDEERCFRQVHLAR